MKAHHHRAMKGRASPMDVVLLGMCLLVFLTSGAEESTAAGGVQCPAGGWSPLLSHDAAQSGVLCVHLSRHATTMGVDVERGCRAMHPNAHGLSIASKGVNDEVSRLVFTPDAAAEGDSGSGAAVAVDLSPVFLGGVVGVSNSETKNQLQWFDGAAADFSALASRERATATGGCLALQRDGNWQLDDCTQVKHRFLCGLRVTSPSAPAAAKTPRGDAKTNTTRPVERAAAAVSTQWADAQLSAPQPETLCWEGWTPFVGTNHCYAVAGSATPGGVVSADAYEAEAWCSQNAPAGTSGHLPTSNNQATNEFLSSLLRNADPSLSTAYIGGMFVAGGAVGMWRDGLIPWSPSGLPFAEGVPSSNFGCIALQLSEDSGRSVWITSDCQVPRPFLCSYTGVPTQGQQPREAGDAPAPTTTPLGQQQQSASAKNTSTLCPSDEWYSNGQKCFLLVANETTSASSADAACRGLLPPSTVSFPAATAATIGSAEDQATALAAANGRSVLLGGAYVEYGGEGAWFDYTTPWGYSEWALRQPSTSRGCILMAPDGKWYSRGCTTAAPAFLCSTPLAATTRPPPPVPTTAPDATSAPSVEAMNASQNVTTKTEGPIPATPLVTSAPPPPPLQDRIVSLSGRRHFAVAHRSTGVYTVDTSGEGISAEGLILLFTTSTGECTARNGYAVPIYDGTVVVKHNFILQRGQVCVSDDGQNFVPLPVTYSVNPARLDGLRRLRTPLDISEGVAAADPETAVTIDEGTTGGLQLLGAKVGNIKALRLSSSDRCNAPKYTLGPETIRVTEGTIGYNLITVRQTQLGAADPDLAQDLPNAFHVCVSVDGDDAASLFTEVAVTVTLKENFAELSGIALLEPPTDDGNGAAHPGLPRQQQQGSTVTVFQWTTPQLTLQATGLLKGARIRLSSVNGDCSRDIPHATSPVAFGVAGSVNSIPYFQLLAVHTEEAATLYLCLSRSIYTAFLPTGFVIKVRPQQLRRVGGQRELKLNLGFSGPLALTGLQQWTMIPRPFTDAMRLCLSPVRCNRVNSNTKYYGSPVSQNHLGLNHGGLLGTHVVFSAGFFTELTSSPLHVCLVVPTTRPDADHETHTHRETGITVEVFPAQLLFMRSVAAKATTTLPINSTLPLRADSNSLSSMPQQKPTLITVQQHAANVRVPLAGYGLRPGMEMLLATVPCAAFVEAERAGLVPVGNHLTEYVNNDAIVVHRVPMTQLYDPFPLSDALEWGKDLAVVLSKEHTAVPTREHQPWFVCLWSNNTDSLSPSLDVRSSLIPTGFAIEVVKPTVSSIAGVATSGTEAMAAVQYGANQDLVVKGVGLFDDLRLVPAANCSDASSFLWDPAAPSPLSLRPKYPERIPPAAVITTVVDAQSDYSSRFFSLTQVSTSFNIHDAQTAGHALQWCMSIRPENLWRASRTSSNEESSVGTNDTDAKAKAVSPTAADDYEAWLLSLKTSGAVSTGFLSTGIPFRFEVPALTGFQSTDTAGEILPHLRLPQEVVSYYVVRATGSVERLPLVYLRLVDERRECSYAADPEASINTANLLALRFGTVAFLPDQIPRVGFYRVCFASATPAAIRSGLLPARDLEDAGPHVRVSVVPHQPTELFSLNGSTRVVLHQGQTAEVAVNGVGLDMAALRMIPAGSTLIPSQADCANNGTTTGFSSRVYPAVAAQRFYAQYAPYFSRLTVATDTVAQEYLVCVRHHRTGATVGADSPAEWQATRLKIVVKPRAVLALAADVAVDAPRVQHLTIISSPDDASEGTGHAIALEGYGLDPAEVALTWYLDSEAPSKDATPSEYVEVCAGGVYSNIQMQPTASSPTGTLVFTTVLPAVLLQEAMSGRFQTSTQETHIRLRPCLKDIQAESFFPIPALSLTVLPPLVTAVGPQHSSTSTPLSSVTFETARSIQTVQISTNTPIASTSLVTLLPPHIPCNALTPIQKTSDNATHASTGGGFVPFDAVQFSRLQPVVNDRGNAVPSRYLVKLFPRQLDNSLTAGEHRLHLCLTTPLLRSAWGMSGATAPGLLLQSNDEDSAVTQIAASDPYQRTSPEVTTDGAAEVLLPDNVPRIHMIVTGRHLVESRVRLVLVPVPAGSPAIDRCPAGISPQLSRLALSKVSSTATAAEISVRADSVTVKAIQPQDLVTPTLVRRYQVCVSVNNGESFTALSYSSSPSAAGATRRLTYVRMVSPQTITGASFLISIAHRKHLSLPFGYSGFLPLQLATDLPAGNTPQVMIAPPQRSCEATTTQQYYPPLDVAVNSRDGGSSVSLTVNIPTQLTLRYASDWQVCFRSDRAAPFHTSRVTLSIIAVTAINGAAQVTTSEGDLLRMALTGENLVPTVDGFALRLSTNCGAISSEAGTTAIVSDPARFEREDPTATLSTLIATVPVPISTDDTTADSFNLVTCISIDGGVRYVEQAPYVTVKKSVLLGLSLLRQSLEAGPLAPSSNLRVLRLFDEAVSPSTTKGKSHRQDVSVAVFSRGSMDGLSFTLGCTPSTSGSMSKVVDSKATFTVSQFESYFSSEGITATAGISIPICLVTAGRTTRATGVRILLTPSPKLRAIGTVTVPPTSRTGARGVTASTAATATPQLPVERPSTLRIDGCSPSLRNCSGLFVVASVGTRKCSTLIGTPVRVDLDGYFTLPVPTAAYATPQFSASLCVSSPTNERGSWQPTGVVVSYRTPSLLRINGQTALEVAVNRTTLVTLSSDGPTDGVLIGLHQTVIDADQSQPAAGATCSLPLGSTAAVVSNGVVAFTPTMTAVQGERRLCFSVDGGHSYAYSDLSVKVLPRQEVLEAEAARSEPSGHRHFRVARMSRGTLRLATPALPGSLVLLSTSCAFNSHGIPILLVQKGGTVAIAASVHTRSATPKLRICWKALRSVDVNAEQQEGHEEDDSPKFVTSIFTDTADTFQVVPFSLIGVTNSLPDLSASAPRVKTPIVFPANRNSSVQFALSFDWNTTNSAALSSPHPMMETGNHDKEEEEEEDVLLNLIANQELLLRVGSPSCHAMAGPGTIHVDADRSFQQHFTATNSWSTTTKVEPVHRFLSRPNRRGGYNASSSNETMMAMKMMSGNGTMSMEEDDECPMMMDKQHHHHRRRAVGPKLFAALDSSLLYAAASLLPVTTPRALCISVDGGQSYFSSGVAVAVASPSTVSSLVSRKHGRAVLSTWLDRSVSIDVRSSSSAAVEGGILLETATAVHFTGFVNNLGYLVGNHLSLPSTLTTMESATPASRLAKKIGAPLVLSAPSPAAGLSLLVRIPEMPQLNNHRHVRLFSAEIGRELQVPEDSGIVSGMELLVLNSHKLQYDDGLAEATPLCTGLNRSDTTTYERMMVGARGTVVVPRRVSQLPLGPYLAVCLVLRADRIVATPVLIQLTNRITLDSIGGVERGTFPLYQHHHVVATVTGAGISKENVLVTFSPISESCAKMHNARKWKHSMQRLLLVKDNSIDITADMTSQNTLSSSTTANATQAQVEERFLVCFSADGGSSFTAVDGLYVAVRPLTLSGIRKTVQSPEAAPGSEADAEKDDAEAEEEVDHRLLLGPTSSELRTVNEPSQNAHQLLRFRAEGGKSRRQEEEGPTKGWRTPEHYFDANRTTFVGTGLVGVDGVPTILIGVMPRGVQRCSGNLFPNRSGTSMGATPLFTFRISTRTLQAVEFTDDALAAALEAFSEDGTDGDLLMCTSTDNGDTFYSSSHQRVFARIDEQRPDVAEGEEEEEGEEGRAEKDDDITDVDFVLRVGTPSASHYPVLSSASFLHRVRSMAARLLPRFSVADVGVTARLHTTIEKEEEGAKVPSSPRFSVVEYRIRLYAPDSDAVGEWYRAFLVKAEQLLGLETETEQEAEAMEQEEASWDLRRRRRQEEEGIPREGQTGTASSSSVPLPVGQRLLRYGGTDPADHWAAVPFFPLSLVTVGPDGMEVSLMPVEDLSEEGHSNKLLRGEDAEHHLRVHHPLTSLEPVFFNANPAGTSTATKAADRILGVSDALVLILIPIFMFVLTRHIYRKNFDVAELQFLEEEEAHQIKVHEATVQRHKQRREDTLKREEERMERTESVLLHSPTLGVVPPTFY